MLSDKNYKIAGGSVAEMIHDCFKPDIDIYVFRDISPEGEEIYVGKAADLPSLQNYWVIDMWWDFYYGQFNIEVK